MQIYFRGNVMAKLSNKGVKRLKHCNAKGLCTVCLTPIKEGERVLRGAHYKCYFRVYRKIKSGAMTEQHAIVEGIFREHEQCGRKPIEVSDLPENVR